MKNQHFKIFSAVVFIIAMLLLTVIALPLINTVISGNSNDFEHFISGFGTFGLIVMMLIQIAQIIVAIIPGEIVEFVAGTIYGWFGGLVFCLIGIAIGQTIIFVAVRYFGKSFAEKIAGSEAIKKYKFLNNEKHLKSIIFLLYFIPGTPKDLLTYIVPLTNINICDFLIITLFARIPSVVTSTYGGDAFASKDYLTLAIVYAAIILFSVGGVLLYRLFESKRKNKQ